MKLGIFAKTFEGTDPEPVLKAIAKAGYSCAQYNMACSGLPSMPDELSVDAARAVADASRSTGVEIVAVSGTYNMIHSDLATRQSGHRRLSVLAERCADMGTRLITLCTGTRDPVDQWKEHPDNNSPEAWSDLLESMETAVQIAERFDVDLGVEPELANVVNSAEKARRLIAELKSPRIKIVLDPANLFEVASLDEQRKVVSSAIDLLSDRIIMAHAKDRSGEGRFATAGTGVLDYDHYLSRLSAIGFTGSLVTHGLAASEAASVAEFLKDRSGRIDTVRAGK
jgi:sugar phosphate isomerase/epimerase